MPVHLLASNYWLHLLTAVVWVGGLALMALVVSPGLARRQMNGARLPALRARERRLSRLNVTLCVLILLFTALATAQ